MEQGISQDFSNANKAAEASHEAAQAANPLWERFKDATMERLETVERAVRSLLEANLDEETRREAEREAHKLAGSAAVFGFAKSSSIAREIELTLRSMSPAGPEQARRISEMASALRRELEGPPLAPPPPAAALTDDSPLLLIVDDDPELAQRLTMEAAAKGIRAVGAHALADARSFLSRERPDVVLLDLSFPEDQGSGFTFLKELVRGETPLPVMVLTASDTFLDRVEVARLGGRSFLPKSLPAAQILDHVCFFLAQRQLSEARILAVDDDPAILAALQGLLDSKGYLITTLEDPLRFWETLEEAAPDLLILDMDMPHISGVELCRTVRNDARWCMLPVLFLTANTDAAAVQRVFAAGADDFVGKPMIGPELMARVANRLERMQLYRSRADTDDLTGIANRRKSSEVLNNYLRLARRHGQPLSLALIDLDYFKQVNDRHGHAAGDVVLRRVGQVLKQSFRSEDIVTRWGGEEFVVGMYTMRRNDGVQRLADVLETFRTEEFKDSEGRPFHITFSSGVAQYPDDGADLHSLYLAADKALYSAKRFGRNRVIPSGWNPAGDEAGIVDVVLVDDDNTASDQILQALETRGYRAERFQDGQEALRKLGGSDPYLQTRVLLLDGDFSGAAGLADLFARNSRPMRTRVILYNSPSERREGPVPVEAGVFDYLTKPVSVPVLLQRIRRAFDA
ncbi:MAG: response regulator [Armatimonadetes bacterium]|nr:response regulator [Armatimonadota bacterium]